jgi:hypothetical protein
MAKKASLKFSAPADLMEFICNHRASNGNEDTLQSNASNGG